MLVNSIPKAGTHLVTTLLDHVPGIIHSGRHYELDQFELPTAWSLTGEYDWTRVEQSLRSVRRGQYLSGHFAAHPRLLKLLEALNFKCIYVVRDPRDVVVSAVHYIVEHPHHPLRERYLHEFVDTEERILATIRGRPESRLGRGWLPVGQELSRYAGWLSHEPVYVCRFEELIGDQGGGSLRQQSVRVGDITSFLGLSMPDDEIDEIARRLWSPESATFRSGKIGEWRKHFTDEHRNAFKEEAGDWLMEMGYEDSHSW